MTDVTDEWEKAAASAIRAAMALNGCKQVEKEHPDVLVGCVVHGYKTRPIGTDGQYVGIAHWDEWDDDMCPVVRGRVLEAMASDD